MFKNKKVRRLMFWTTSSILALTVILVPAIIILPDQLRSLPQPPPPFVSLLASVSPLQTDTGPQAEIGDPQESPRPAQETATQWQWEEPDVSGLPPEFQSAWEQYRQQMLALFDEYLKLPPRTKDMPLDDALAELAKLAQNAQDIKRESRNDDSPTTQTLAMDLWMSQHDEVHREAKRGICVVREEWDRAAATYFIAQPPGKGRDIHEGWEKWDWDAITYYRRKDGLRGRTLIGLMSTLKSYRRFFCKSAKGFEGDVNRPGPPPASGDARRVIQ